ncbi:helix-turn-helix domain-containing protein [Plantactinospora soyae]|uniref:Transcriptional regulator with XRE-family HTH domain/tetratricopeptide (TPR) repeat protein n=1 Tax=Plantactinospora soyae TaxID=1544732 RepID=A0A927M617_9ACTN|nr:helix-turn-helix transcriptional regulator [Plantactinospora soyae]MBE1487505.1 transcriptional regulator with XRE-family HTH domain/tetratricopeptide (TPR) repeat protein [Plantactinospora soyae]
MPRQIVAVDPTFGQRLKELRERRGLSLRRLGQQVHCSHGYLWDLEAGGKRPSLSVVTLLDAALDAGGQLSALVRTVSADSGGRLAPSAEQVGVPGTGLEFAPDWRHGVVVATKLWREDMQRRDLLVGTGFSAALFLTPALRWLTTRLDERPAGDGDRLVGAPNVETVRQITNVYRTLDNQYGGAHVRDGLVRFLNADVAPMLQGRYDARTGAALFSAAAEATQLAGWACYDVGMHGLAQRYLVQALRLAAAAGDQPFGAEILAAMSHQAAYLGASAEAVDLARAAGRTAAEAGVGAIQAESAVLEAQGHAVGGDEAACADALDRAERAFDRADRTSAPQWIGYFDESYLAAKFGHCFSALGRGELATRFAKRSLQMDGRKFARGRQFNFALLAVAHAQSGEIEQAGSVGVQAVEAAEGLGSVRSRDYLAALAARLAPHVGLPEVRAFSERVRPVLQPV